MRMMPVPSIAYLADIGGRRSLRSTRTGPPKVSRVTLARVAREQRNEIIPDSANQDELDQLRQRVKRTRLSDAEIQAWQVEAVRCSFCLEPTPQNYD